MEVGSDLGLGLSHDGDDGGAIGRDRNGGGRVVARKRKEPLSPERPQLAAEESALLSAGQRRLALRCGDDGGRLARRSDVTRAWLSIGRLLDGSLGEIERWIDPGNLTVYHFQPDKPRRITYPSLLLATLTTLSPEGG